MFEMSLFVYLLQLDITEYQYSKLGSARLTLAVHASILEIKSEYNAIYKSSLDDCAWMDLVLTEWNSHSLFRLFSTSYLSRKIGSILTKLTYHWSRKRHSFAHEKILIVTSKSQWKWIGQLTYLKRARIVFQLIWVFKLRISSRIYDQIFGLIPQFNQIFSHATLIDRLKFYILIERYVWL